MFDPRHPRICVTYSPELEAEALSLCEKYKKLGAHVTSSCEIDRNKIGGFTGSLFYFDTDDTVISIAKIIANDLNKIQKTSPRFLSISEGCFDYMLYIVAKPKIKPVRDESRLTLSKCPQCGSRVSEHKMSKHLSHKCSASNKMLGPIAKTRSRLIASSGKFKQTVKQVPRCPGPVVKNKKLCPECNRVYLNTESHCPNCREWKAKEATFVICELCNCRYPPNKVASHLRNNCEYHSVPCVLCELNVLRRDMATHVRTSHSLEQQNQITDNKERREFINYFRVRPKGQKVRSVTRRARCQIGQVTWNKSKRRNCRQCGRPAMYNSTHCYSCGDK